MPPSQRFMNSWRSTPRPAKRGWRRWQDRRSTRSRRAAGEQLEPRILLTAADPVQPLSLPLSFEPNVGQAVVSAQFVSRGQGYSLRLNPTGAVLALDSVAVTEPARVQMHVVGANPHAEARGTNRLLGYSNYFLGNDPTQWRTGVPHFGRIVYDDVYPDIDLVYYGTDQSQLEYDFVVAPGADPGSVTLQFEGANELQMDNAGNLVLHTEPGDLVQQAPVIYQETHGHRQLIEGAYVLLAKDRIGFKVGDYDPTLPLVIDPVLSYSSFLGGTLRDYASDIEVDAAGNMYITGARQQQTQVGTITCTDYDAFVTKLTPAGDAVVYSTFIGGQADPGCNHPDQGNSLLVDASGNVYLVGDTQSEQFPVTGNAFDPDYNLNGSPGTLSDGFLLKLDSTGANLLYSTYLGGRGMDVASDLAQGSDGNIYVVGSTNSDDVTTTIGAFQTTHDGQSDEAFVMKINPVGGGLVYSTYLGGSVGTPGNVSQDRGQAIALDASDNVYVAGSSQSTDFPTTAGTVQPNHAGSSDAFVAKMNLAGGGVSDLIFSTFLGGANDGNVEMASDIVLDATGNIFLTGATGSRDVAATPEDESFPTTPGAYQTTNAGSRDIFVSKLDATASTLMYSTYLGGFGEDGKFGLNPAVAHVDLHRPRMEVDSLGNAYVTATIRSGDFPTTADALPQPPFGTDDGILAQLSPAGDQLLFSTYFGGTGDDASRGIELVEATGRLYISGGTASNETQGFPLVNPLQPVFGGDRDAFVAVFDFGPITNEVSWISDTDGFWDVGSNWSTGAPPQPGQSVIIDRAAADVTVTYRGGALNVEDLRTDETLVISTVGLAVDNEAEVTGTLRILAGASFELDTASLLVSGGLVDNAGALTASDTEVTLASGTQLINRSGGVLTVVCPVPVAGAAAPLFEITGGSQLTNDLGGIVDLQHVSLQVSGSTVDNSGALTASDTDVTLASGAQLINRSGGVLTLVCPNPVTGAAAPQFALTGSSQLLNETGGTVDLQIASLQVSGSTVNNAGVFSLSDSPLELANGSELINRAGGVVTVVCPTPVAGGAIPLVEVTSGSQLMNEAGGAIDLQAVTLEVNGATVDNAGALTAADTDVTLLSAAQLMNRSGGVFTLACPTPVAGAAVPRIELSGDSTLVNHEGGMIQANGDLNMTVQNAVVQNAGTMTFNGGGQLTLSNTALFENLPGIVAEGGTIIVVDPNFRIALTGGSTLTNGATMDVAGSLEVDGSTVENSGMLSTAGGVQLTGGATLGGTGFVNGPVANLSGVVSPGFSFGILNNNGDYSQAAGGVLELEIGGPVPGDDHDQFNVSGTASVDGLLRIIVTGGFAPNEGDDFSPFTYNALVGGFSNVEVVDPLGQADFELTFGPTGLIATAVDAAPEITTISIDAQGCGDTSPGETVNLSANFVPAGSLESHAATIDWGDGTVSAGIIGGTSEEATVGGSHAYAEGGIFPVSVTVTDGDGDSATADAIAIITGVGLRDGVLQIVGTNEADDVLVSKLFGKMVVFADFLPFPRIRRFPFGDVLRIEARMCAGNDDAHAPLVATPTFMDGGPGDDRLTGGLVGDVLLGAEGNDTLLGSTGNDLLRGGPGEDNLLGGPGDDIVLGESGDDKMYGGLGRDVLIGGLDSDLAAGGRGEDILIGGITAHDDNDAALRAIMAEWTSERTFEERIANLTDGSGTLIRDNGDVFLTHGGTVLDDGVADELFGKLGRDWFFTFDADLAMDLVDGVDE